jgi:hypothetical protein
MGHFGRFLQDSVQFWWFDQFSGKRESVLVRQSIARNDSWNAEQAQAKIKGATGEKRGYEKEYEGDNNNTAAGGNCTYITLDGWFTPSFPTASSSIDPGRHTNTAMYRRGVRLQTQGEGWKGYEKGTALESRFWVGKRNILLFAWPRPGLKNLICTPGSWTMTTMLGRLRA